MLAILKDCIAQARKESSSTTKSKATIFREALREAYAENNSSAIEAIEFLAVDEAEIIERQHGLSVAQAFHDEATAVAPTLAEAAEEWLSATATKESTRLKRREAYEGLRAFLGKRQCLSCNIESHPGTWLRKAKPVNSPRSALRNIARNSSTRS